MEIFPELLLIYFDSMRPCFSRYSAPLFEGYAFGILLCNGRKCMKRIAGLCWFVDRHLNSFERFLADHQWSSSELTKCWYRLLIKRLSKLGISTSQKVFAIDTTLVQKVKGRMLGVQKWSAHPGDNKAEKRIIGHHWAILGLLVRFGDRYLCFGLFTRLISGKLNPAEMIVDANGACQIATFWDSIHAMIWQTLTLTETSITVVCDAYFSKKGFLNPIGYHNESSANKVTVITRMRWDAVCRELEPPEYKGKGRPPTQGRESTVRSLLKTEPLQKWKVWLYGKEHELNGVSVVRKIRNVHNPVKLVIVDNHTSKPIIFLCSDVHQEEEHIIELYGARFSIEFLIREMKSEMGFSQYQCYSTIAFMRFAQLCTIITSMWKLFHIETYPQQQEIRFSSLRTSMKRRSIRTAFSRSLPDHAEFKKLEPLMETVLRNAA